MGQSSLEQQSRSPSLARRVGLWQVHPGPETSRLAVKLPDSDSEDSNLLGISFRAIDSGVWLGD